MVVCDEKWVFMCSLIFPVLNTSISCLPSDHNHYWPFVCTCCMIVFSGIIVVCTYMHIYTHVHTRWKPQLKLEPLLQGTYSSIHRTPVSDQRRRPSFRPSPLPPRSPGVPLKS